MPLGMEVGLSPGDFVLDGAHVYYNYCDIVRTLHSRYWFVQVQVQVLVLYAFYFLEKKFNRSQFCSNINTEANVVFIKLRTASMGADGSSVTELPYTQ